MIPRITRGSWLALLLAAAGPALAADVAGSVFQDGNGNGVHDAGEPALAGIAISNGRGIVHSGADGRYAIEARPGDIVFAIKPAGFRFGKRADGLPDAWVAADTTRVHDFALRAQVFPPARADGLKAVLLADPQVKSLVDVDYYARDIVASVKAGAAVHVVDPAHALPRFYFDGGAADLGLSLGDIVNDDLSLYPAINQVTASLGVPWLHVPGNHDLDADAVDDATSLATFRSTYGPDTVAWEEPEATFIGLDDVIAMPGQRPAYVGGLREDQFAFLEAYLPTVRKDRLLVLGVHIPLFDTAAPGRAATFRQADRERLFALLRDFPHVLLLSAHTHNQQHVLHGPASGWHGANALHEYNVGAACGAFWSGVKDAAGIPDSTMSDGTPNGYAVLTVGKDGEYALAWHNARDAEDARIGLHAPGVLRRGAYPAWAVYANVYMGMDDSLVEFRIDDGSWQPMRKVLQPDPALLVENARDDLADHLRGYDRSPEATPSPHLWRGTLPTDLAVGEHAIEVRYVDTWRGEQRANTSYLLEDHAP
jgi:hypothetical protein